jgi:hypothetical protein
MASADWTNLGGTVLGSHLIKGVSAGITPPNGGGTFIYGFSTLDNTVGVDGLYANATNFAPNTLGGSVRGALQRGPGGGATGFSPFLFVCASAATNAGLAYMLGLQDSDPHRIALVKGPISGGILAGAVAPMATPSGILLASTATYAQGTWLHLRLDAVVNANGDVVLNVFQNDLTANAVSSPVWLPVPGMSQFIDDVLEVNTGSAPLASGYLGFGFSSSQVNRRSFFDELEIIRQTS